MFGQEQVFRSLAVAETVFDQELVEISGQRIHCCPLSPCWQAFVVAHLVVEGLEGRALLKSWKLVEMMERLCTLQQKTDQLVRLPSVVELDQFVDSLNHPLGKNC